MESQTNTNYTIHIFGYGETQINADYSFKDATDSFTNVTPLLDALFAKKPADNLMVEKEYHIVHIFNGGDIRWQGKNGFNLKKEEIDANLLALIENLKTELKAKYDAKVLADSQAKTQV